MSILKAIERRIVMDKITQFLQTAGKGKTSYMLIGVGLAYLWAGHLAPGVVPPIDSGLQDAVQKTWQLLLAAAVRRAIG
jgi:hypothetical protein